MTDARQQIDEAWQDFLDVLKRVPDDRLEEKGACGDWSVKDVMAHIAFWDDRTVLVADTLGAGQEVEPFNWQEANTQEAALRSTWTAEESRREMHAAHERLIEALYRHPDLRIETWEGGTSEHYAEHTDDIRAWLETSGA